MVGEIYDEMPGVPRQVQDSVTYEQFLEALHYKPLHNFTGALHEFGQTNGTRPEVFNIPSPRGAECLAAIELHFGKEKTRGLARSRRDARHQAAERMLHKLGDHTFTYIRQFE